MSKIILLILIVAIAFMFYNKSKKNKQAAIENASTGSAFLADNAKDPDVVTTESGLQFKILETGTGDIHPKASDNVKVHYHGTLIDGRVFDSSVDRGEPISFGLNQVIKGWTEGVQLMVVGEKRRLFIPSELAYGQSSTGIITPGSTLIFDVELLEIN
ncbi:putative peptidyl-prolyl cis-trans isomerase, FKBP-type [Marinomonas sp. MED121]|uniref:FKBP-type peptidyl-prolyl cis-trans isomerase n=1 Tax=Marinomonas sp. MED121 TaxID=314277 RepID=UPI0000691239|nr:FKBP-type peptidyl-prolyl cis-trans isomerase [Marinomonas sp. MED121]EAQ67310.1 putative peptidyl-prolyl cis-trans isomerase, FKBP-type [Marinomonas sp. MED121]